MVGAGSAEAARGEMGRRYGWIHDAAIEQRAKRFLRRDSRQIDLRVLRDGLRFHEVAAG